MCDLGQVPPLSLPICKWGWNGGLLGLGLEWRPLGTRAVIGALRGLMPQECLSPLKEFKCDLYLCLLLVKLQPWQPRPSPGVRARHWAHHLWPSDPITPATSELDRRQERKQTQYVCVAYPTISLSFLRMLPGGWYFHTWQNRGSERFTSSPKATQLVSGWVWI